MIYIADLVQLAVDRHHHDAKKLARHLRKCRDIIRVFAAVIAFSRFVSIFNCALDRLGRWHGSPQLNLLFLWLLSLARLLGDWSFRRRNKPPQ